MYRYKQYLAKSNKKIVLIHIENYHKDPKQILNKAIEEYIEYELGFDKTHFNPHDWSKLINYLIVFIYNPKFSDIKAKKIS